MMLAPTLAVLIVVGYAAALWWWLRRESMLVLLGLLSVCAAALSLRLVYTTEYPPGLTGDEPKILACSAELLQSGRLATEGCTGLPVLLNALFQAQLVPVFGPGRWAIRSYSLVTSVLAVPAAFAVARALALDIVSSLSVSIFLAVLPWSIFYGRVSIGGELIFHELLLVGALARLVWHTEESWPDLGIGGLGLCLLLYDYFCGRVMLGMPLAAALLARGRRRWLCIAVLVLAVIGWAPYLHSNPPNALSGVLLRLHPDLLAQPLQTLSMKVFAAVHGLVAPVGEDWTLTIRAGAMHPLLILALAVAGVFVAGWRGLFLAAGFVGGLLSAIVSSGTSASVHRMLMALPFIALAAGAALDALPRYRGRVLVVCLLVLLIGVASVRLFFSPAFWPVESRAAFDAGATALIESLPPPPRPRVIYAQQAEDFLTLQRLVDPQLEVLTAQNWLPEHGPAIYVFAHPDTAAFRAFYLNLFGVERVHVFDQAFFVELKPSDAVVLRQHGWAYEVRCDTKVQRWRVPTLYHAHLGAGDVPCPSPVANTWRGRWEGPATALMLRFSGAARVQTSAGVSISQEGFEMTLPFDVTPGTDVTVTVVATPPADRNVWWDALLAELVEVTPAGERIPLWESVRPNVEPDTALAAAAPQ
jgi:hypothetical protein